MSISMQAEALARTRIIQLQGGGLRFLDALQTSQCEFRVVTRPPCGTCAPRWKVVALGDGVSAIAHLSSGRYLAAHESDALDFAAVARPRRDDDSQRWRIEDFGGGFATIEQVSTGRFLEAMVDGDFIVVTRPAGSSEQTWRIGEP